MTEYAYTLNDNEIIVEFQEDGVAKDLSASTKIELQLFLKKSGPVKRQVPVASWNSVDNAALFDTSLLGIGKLTVKPDSTAISGLTESKYFGRLIVFSADYPNGMVWAKRHDDLFEFVVSR